MVTIKEIKKRWTLTPSELGHGMAVLAHNTHQLLLAVVVIL